jgi:hypothetical protein
MHSSRNKKEVTVQKPPALATWAGPCGVPDDTDVGPRHDMWQFRSRGSLIQRLTLNNRHQTSNIEQQASNIKQQTSNNEYQTANNKQ